MVDVDTANSPARPVLGLIPPTSAGSLGDQAMIDAIAEYVIREFKRPVWIFPNQMDLRAEAKFLSGRSLVAALAASLRGIVGAREVALVGADVLDGTYSSKSVLLRLKALKAANFLGRKTRVLGSSWSLSPSAEVVSYLRDANWLEVFARDPISQGRMERDLQRPIQLVADCAFLLQAEARSASAKAALSWAQGCKINGATILGVNLSGHTINNLPDASVAPYVRLVTAWLDADPTRRVLIIPHDHRPGLSGDGMVSEELIEALPEAYAARVYIPDGPLQAWDAKAVVGAVDLVLTGRMHLAIAALGQGTPPVSIVYQSKFEGLMAHFGLEEKNLTMEPDTPLKSLDTALGLLERATTERAALSAHIKKILPTILDLSRTNFEGLQK